MKELCRATQAEHVPSMSATQGTSSSKVEKEGGRGGGRETHKLVLVVLASCAGEANGGSFLDTGQPA